MCCCADVVPPEKLTELALQQLSLNAAPQLVHFYGICRTEDCTMLVYEYVEASVPPRQLMHVSVKDSTLLQSQNSLAAKEQPGNIFGKAQCRNKSQRPVIAGGSASCVRCCREAVCGRPSS